MDKLLPIVPGCLCLVTKGPYMGAQPTAIRYAGESPNNVEPYSDCWEVTPPGSDDSCDWYASASILMRIDGHQPDERDITEKEKENENALL